MLKIDKIDDENIRIRQDSTDVNVAAIFFASVGETGMVTLYPKHQNAYRTFSDRAVEINGENVSGKSPEEIVNELNSFVGNFRKGGGSSANNPAAALKASPHLWETNTEIDFGDGSFGRRFTGTIAAQTSMDNELLFPLQGIAFFLVDSGGWFYYGGKYRMTANAYGSSSLYSFLRFEGGIGLWFHSQCSNVRTNDPYDIWIIYTKSQVIPSLMESTGEITGLEEI